MTGWPELPPPPPPEVVAGPDGRHHTIIYRIMRWPGGITAQGEELGLGLGQGYRLDLTIDHEGNPDELLVRLRRAVRWAVAHPQMEPQEWYGWGLVEDEAGGRLSDDEPSELPLVVIDGHSLSWEDFGRLLTPYVGWSFHLRLGVEPNSGEGELGLARARKATPQELAATAKDMMWFVTDSSHYLSPEQWRRRDRHRDR